MFVPSANLLISHLADMIHPLVLPTVMSLFEKLKQVPKTSELSIPAPTSDKPVWEASHDGFLAWGTAKAIRESRKPSERDVHSRLGRNAEAAADFLRRMDDVVMDSTGEDSDTPMA